MGFKFKIGDLVLLKQAIVQQAIQRHTTSKVATIAKVVMVTALVSVERADGLQRSYYVSSGDEVAEVVEHEIIGLDGYNPDFTPDEAINFVKGGE